MRSARSKFPLGDRWLKAQQRAIFAYEKGSANKLVLQEKGDDGLEGMEDAMRDGKVQFAYVRQPVSFAEGTAPIDKFFFIFYANEGLALGTKRADIVRHSQELSRAIGSFNVFVNATKEEELTESALLVCMGLGLGVCAMILFRMV